MSKNVNLGNASWWSIYHCLLLGFQLSWKTVGVLASWVMHWSSVTNAVNTSSKFSVSNLHWNHVKQRASSFAQHIRHLFTRHTPLYTHIHTARKQQVIAGQSSSRPQYLKNNARIWFNQRRCNEMQYGRGTLFNKYIYGDWKQRHNKLKPFPLYTEIPIVAWRTLPDQ